MKTLAKKYKLFIVITLALLVVGMALLGFLDFNKSIDQKESYEVRVSVEQKIDGALTILQNSTQEYFESKNIKPADYAFQKIADGRILVYKFDKDVKINEGDLEAFVQGKLDADTSITDLTATADYNQVLGYDDFNAGWLLLGLGVAIVAAFIYAIIMEKLAGSVATVGVSVLSALLFTAIMSIVRLPAHQLATTSVALATLLGAVVAISTVSKLNAQYKLSSSKDTFEIADKVMKNECKKYIFIGICVLVGALAISAFFVPYMMFVGGQILLAGISALACSYFGAPLVWSLIKGKKSK